MQKVVRTGVKAKGHERAQSGGWGEGKAAYFKYYHPYI
jgi:hypothetical protein